MSVKKKLLEKVTWIWQTSGEKSLHTAEWFTFRIEIREKNTRDAAALRCVFLTGDQK